MTTAKWLKVSDIINILQKFEDGEVGFTFPSDDAKKALDFLIVFLNGDDSQEQMNLIGHISDIFMIAYECELSRKDKSSSYVCKFLHSGEYISRRCVLSCLKGRGLTWLSTRSDFIEFIRFIQGECNSFKTQNRAWGFDITRNKSNL